MDRDEIGDRFKDYESCWDFTLPRRMPMVIRVDGRAFHSLKLEKPFDPVFFQWMARTAHALCEEIQGARWAFFQSDEISVIVRDDMSLQTQPWMGKRLSKVLSLSAAIATAAFNEDCAGHFGPREFDARAFVLPTVDEVVNYCIWRQQDATRNSILMAAQGVFSHKQMHQKNTTVLREMLEQAGKPWEETPTHFKRGAVTRRIASLKVVPQTGQTCERREWLPDLAAPIFTQDRDYLLRLWDPPTPTESAPNSTDSSCLHPLPAV
jgi:tRNA(His) guanylyltransferase